MIHVTLHGTIITGVYTYAHPDTVAVEYEGVPPHGARLVDGQVVLPATPPPTQWHYPTQDGGWAIEPDVAWALVRAERLRRLALSDVVVTRAQERGEPVPPQWLAYRQALRDITEQPDPERIQWPVAPET